MIDQAHSRTHKPTMKTTTDQALDVAAAVRLLTQAGAVFSLPPAQHLSVGEAAARLDFSARWVKEHLDEFPHAWRAPGGELRIPARDIEAMAKRCRIRRDIR